MTFIKPNWVIVEFLRKNLTDPRESRRPTLNSQTFTATSLQTEFTFSITSGYEFCYIDSVKVESVTKTKWVDYYIDFRTRKIVFYDGITEDEEVEINVYETTSNWIFWDLFHKKLSADSFPRVAISMVAGTGSRLGNYQAPIQSYMTFQTDIFVKEKGLNQIFTIDGSKYTGDDLADRIAYDISQAIQDNEDELHPVLYDYVPSGFPPRYISYDEDFQAFRRICSFNLKGLNIGFNN